MELRLSAIIKVNVQKYNYSNVYLKEAFVLKHVYTSFQHQEPSVKNHINCEETTCRKRENGLFCFCFVFVGLCLWNMEHWPICIKFSQSLQQSIARIAYHSNLHVTLVNREINEWWMFKCKSKLIHIAYKYKWNAIRKQAFKT